MGVLTGITEVIKESPTLLAIFQDRFCPGWSGEQSNFPRLVYNLITETVDSLDSCMARYTVSNYQFDAYTRSLGLSQQAAAQIYEIFDTRGFYAGPRRIVQSFLHSSTKTSELEPGIWRSTVSFEAIMQDQLANNYWPHVTNAPDLYSGIFIRISQYIPELFVYSAGYQPEEPQRNWPYIWLPVVSTTENHRDTDGSILDTSVSFGVYSHTLPELEELLDKFKMVFDYSVLGMNGQRTYVFEWVQTGIREQEPGVWHGSLMYNVQYGKAYTTNQLTAGA